MKNLSKKERENIDKLVNKYDSLKKENNLDLSADEDLSIAIMNLISIEEHLFFSGSKTGDKKYYDLLNEIRLMRTDLLKKIIKKYEGEVWCISKHLLAASYRLLEYGTKQLKKGEKKEAYEMFEKGYNLYSLFWALNMGIISLEEINK